MGEGLEGKRASIDFPASALTGAYLEKRYYLQLDSDVSQFDYASFSPCDIKIVQVQLLSVKEVQS